MADKRISDLTPAANIQQTDILPIVNNGETRRVSLGDLGGVFSLWQPVPSGNGIFYPTGDVGIGTQNPTATLDVDGDMRIRSIQQDNTLDRVVVSTPSGELYFRDASTLQDADADPTNELQSLSLSGNTLSLSNGGGSITLPGGSGQSGADLDGQGLRYNPLDQKLHVNPGNGLAFNQDQVEVNPSDLEGEGLTVANNRLAVNPGPGIVVVNDQITINNQDLAGSGITANPLSFQLDLIPDNRTVEIGANNEVKVKEDGISSTEIQDASILLPHLNQNGAATGQGLLWNGTAWAPGSLGNSQWTQSGADIYRSGGRVGIGVLPSPLGLLNVFNVAMGDEFAISGSLFSIPFQPTNNSAAVKGANQNYGTTFTPNNIHAGVWGHSETGTNGSLKVGLLGTCTPSSSQQSIGLLAEGSVGPNPTLFGWSGVFRNGSFNVGDPFKSTPEHFLHVSIAGNVGANTNNPSETLDVNGTARIRSLNQSSTLNAVLVADSQGVLHVRDASTLGGGSSLWTQRNDNLHYTVGNVGIGTTAPQDKLHVEGGGEERILVRTNSGLTNTLAEFQAQNNVGNAIRTGISSPVAQNFRNVAYSLATGSSTTKMVIGTEGSNAPVECWVDGRTQLSISRDQIQMGNNFVGAPLNSRLLVDGSAAKNSGGTTWATFSDGRLKKAKKDLPLVLDKLLQLKPRTFKWRKPENHGGCAEAQMGFVAQEVREVFPEWVEGNDKKRGEYLLFNPVGIEAVLVKAIQEQQAQINLLKDQVDSLLSA